MEFVESNANELSLPDSVAAEEHPALVVSWRGHQVYLFLAEEQINHVTKCRLIFQNDFHNALLLTVTGTHFSVVDKLL